VKNQNPRVWSQKNGRERQKTCGGAEEPENVVCPHAPPEHTGNFRIALGCKVLLLSLNTKAQCLSVREVKAAQSKSELLISASQLNTRPRS